MAVCPHQGCAEFGEKNSKGNLFFPKTILLGLPNKTLYKAIKVIIRVHLAKVCAHMDCSKYGPQPAAAAPPGDLYISGPQPRPAKSEVLAVGPSTRTVFREHVLQGTPVHNLSPPVLSK